MAIISPFDVVCSTSCKISTFHLNDYTNAHEREVAAVGLKGPVFRYTQGILAKYIPTLCPSPLPLLIEYNNIGNRILGQYLTALCIRLSQPTDHSHSEHVQYYCKDTISSSDVVEKSRSHHIPLQ